MNLNLLHPLSMLWAIPIGGAIVLMYILKLRRKDVVVSSTYLWRTVIRDVQANAPFQRLRKSLVLLLQLVAAALIIAALTRPFLRVSAVGGRDTVLIVDTSASMAATDVTPSRIAEARRKAHERIDRMRPGDRMMVMSAFSRPEAVTGFTTERAELHRAVDGLRVHETGTNIRDALNLAADLAAARNAGETGRIELISDGAFEARPGAAANQTVLSNVNLGRTHLEFYPVGAGHDNVGITAVDFRRSLTGEKTVQALVVTRNFSGRPRQFNEEIYEEDNLVDAHEVSLAAGAENTEPYDLAEPTSPTRLRVHLDIKDDLAIDNDAALILKPRKVVRALLVGKENVFLENALRVDPGVDLSRAPAYSGASGYDVIIFNESAPSVLPPGNYLFIHCAGDQAPVTVDGSASNVAAADWEKDHPVLRYVDFGSDRFATALRASARPWGREIATAESGALVAAGERNRQRSVFLGFSLSQSMFPLRVAFPLLISNSVRWLGAGEDSEIGQETTGSAIVIPAPAGLGKLTVTRPDGSKEMISVGERGGAAFNDADLVGAYRAVGQGFQYDFAANLASQDESDTTPRRSVLIADNPAGSAGRRVTENRELLPFVVILTLVVLAVEWWAFHRRIYVS